MPAPIYPLLPPPETIPSISLARNPDHLNDAFGRLLTQFKDKARLKKLIEIFLRPIQELEETFWTLYLNRRLSTDIDAQLDIFGRIVGEKRNGLINSDFRAVLSAKIKVLLSRGTPEDIIAIVRLMTNGTPTFTLTEIPPATIHVQLNGPPAFSIALLKRLLNSGKAGGVRLDLIYTAPSGVTNTLRVGSSVSGTTFPGRIGSSASTGAAPGHLGSLA